MYAEYGTLFIVLSLVIFVYSFTKDVTEKYVFMVLFRVLAFILAWAALSVFNLASAASTSSNTLIIVSNNIITANSTSTTISAPATTLAYIINQTLMVYIFVILGSALMQATTLFIRRMR